MVLLKYVKRDPRTESVHNSPSAPNGIWNISAIQGRSHELKVWEKASQSISPSPVPHSTKHWSYVRVNGGGGSVGPCVAFHSAEYWFCRLAAHFHSWMASTRVVNATRRMTNGIAVGEKASSVICNRGGLSELTWAAE